MFIRTALPGNWITDEENSCYPNSSLPSNCSHRSIISLDVHHAYLIIAQNILVYSTLTHRAGVVNFPCIVRVHSVSDYSQNCLRIHGFSSNNFADFPVIFFTNLAFFSNIKRVQYQANHVQSVLNDDSIITKPKNWKIC